MKQYSLLILLLTLSIAISSQEYKGTVFFESKSIREENDSLHIAFDIHIQKNAVKDYVSMRLIPELYGSDQFLSLPQVEIKGDNKRRMKARWQSLKGRQATADSTRGYAVIDRLNKTADTILHYDLHIPYQLWMDKALLVLRQELSGYRDERSLNTFVLASAVQRAARTPYRVQPLVSICEPAPERKCRSKQGQAFLDFQVGRTVILPDFRRNPIELSKIKEVFTELNSNKDALITGLFIEGYASPEGKYETNERLSKGRAFALKDYIVANYGLNLSGDRITVKWTAEDWEGLKLLVQAGDIMHKNEILSVIEETAVFEGREAKLMKLAAGAPYRIMLKDMFAQLRRVEYQIDYTIRDYSTDEARNLVDKKNELLSQHELYRVALSYGKDSEQYRHIMLDIISGQFAADQTAQINAAAVMISLAETATAKRYLQKYPDNPQAWNNLGVIALLEGDLVQAESYFRKAADNGSQEAEHNLKETDKKRDDNKRMERYKQPVRQTLADRIHP